MNLSLFFNAILSNYERDKSRNEFQKRISSKQLPFISLSNCFPKQKKAFKISVEVSVIDSSEGKSYSYVDTTVLNAYVHS